MELLCIGDVVDSLRGLGEPDMVLANRKLPWVQLGLSFRDS